MEDIYNGEQNLYDDLAFRMPLRPEPLQHGKQFESLGSNFGPSKVGRTRKTQDSRDVATRRDKSGEASGSRVGLSRTSSSRSTFSLDLRDSEFDDSDDELDCLSKRSSSPAAPTPPDPPSESAYLKKIVKNSTGLKGLKFNKISKSGSASSQQSSQPTSAADSTPAHHKENPSRPKTSQGPAVARKIDVDSEPFGNRESDRGRRRKELPVSQPLKNKEPNSKKGGPPKPTRKARQTTPVDDPPKTERPRPRRLQKSTAKPAEPERTPSPVSIQRSSSPNRLTRKPSKFPMDDMTPLAEKKSQPLARKPSSFPVMSPLSGDRSTSKSMASIPPLSSPLSEVEVLDGGVTRDSKKKKGKAKRQVVESRGNRKVLVTDEASSSDEDGGAKLQPFPMSTQDMESINRCASPGPSNLGKRESPGNFGVGRSKKRREDLSPEISWPTFTQHDAEMDNLFPSTHADPKTLCPYCDMPLPSSPTPLLQYLLSPDYTPLYSKSDPDPRPGNRLGRAAPLSAFISVCQRHRFETEILPEAERKRWPKEIDWQALASRVMDMKHIVQELVLDTSGEADGPRESCVFWKEVVKEYREKGSRAVTGVRGQFENFEKTQPGYYGEQGSNIIHQSLYSLCPPSSIDPSSVAPLSPNEFISRVLVPEVAVALIMEDQWSKGDKGKSEAVKILRDSAAYGVAMFPEDGGDWAQAEKSRLSAKNKGKGKTTRKRPSPSEGVNDFEIGVADKIVMERARKRRMEVEEEMRMEDDLLRQQREEAGTRTEDEPWDEGRGMMVEKKTSNHPEEDIAIQEDNSVVRPKQRPKPVPIGRRPAQQRSSSSLNRSNNDTDTSENFSASENRPPRPKTARPKKSKKPAKQSPVVSDFESTYDNPQYAMDWAVATDGILSDKDPDTMDLCSDSSEKAGSSSSKRGSRGTKARSITPNELGFNNNVRTSRSRSRVAKEKEPEDDTDDISILEVSTPRAPASKTNWWEDYNGDTPRPCKITSPTPLVSSSKPNSVFDMLRERNQEAGDLVELPTSSSASAEWVTSMAVDVSDDDGTSSTSTGRRYGGRLGYAGSRQGMKKGSSHSWLLSDESQESI